jgi:hypothetical protein
MAAALTWSPRHHAAASLPLARVWFAQDKGPTLAFARRAACLSKVSLQRQDSCLALLLNLVWSTYAERL